MAAVNETKDSLYNSNSQYEKDIENLRVQLQEVLSNKSFVTQQLETTEVQLSRVKTERVGDCMNI